MLLYKLEIIEQLQLFLHIFAIRKRQFLIILEDRIKKWCADWKSCNIREHETIIKKIYIYRERDTPLSRVRNHITRERRELPPFNKSPSWHSWGEAYFHPRCVPPIYGLRPFAHPRNAWHWANMRHVSTLCQPS